AVSYVATAVDDLGNESAWSAPATVVAPAAWSAAAPSVRWVLPVDDQVAGGADALLAASGGGAAGLSAVNFAYTPAGGSVWVDLGRPIPTSTGGPTFGMSLDQAMWAAPWKTSSLASGPYTVRATFTDAAGYTAESLRTLTLGVSQSRGPPPPGFNLVATAAAGTVKLAWDATGTSFGI